MCMFRQIWSNLSSDWLGKWLQTGELNDTNRQKLITAVAGWLENVALPAHVSFWKRDADETFYEAMLSSGTENHSFSE